MNEDYSDAEKIIFELENYLSEHPIRARMEIAKHFVLGVYEDVKNYSERMLFTGRAGLVSRSLCELIK